MIRSFLLLSLFSLQIAARAEEPAPSQDTQKSYPATFIDGRTDKAVTFSKAPEEVSFAMCGVEAHGAKSDLDAGLIDFNVPDPARYAGGDIDEGKDQGKNARDYHSSVILGVTVGYHF